MGGRECTPSGVKKHEWWEVNASRGELDDGKERSLTRAAGCRLLENYVARALPWPLLVCSAFVRNLVCAVRARQREKETRTLLPSLSAVSSVSIYYTRVSLLRSLDPSFTLAYSVSFFFQLVSLATPNRRVPIPCTFSRLCSSPRFRQGASNARNRERVCARFPTTTLRYEQEIAPTARGERVFRVTHGRSIPTLSTYSVFFFSACTPGEQQRAHGLSHAPRVVARFPVPRENDLSRVVRSTFSAPAFRPIGFRPPFAREEFSPSLVPYHPSRYRHAYTLLLLSSSLFVPPSLCFHLCHPLTASLSPRVFFPGFSDRARSFPSPRGRRDVCRASRLHACTRGESAYRGRAYPTLPTEFSLHPPIACSTRAAPRRLTATENGVSTYGDSIRGVDIFWCRCLVSRVFRFVSDDRVSGVNDRLKS